MDLGDPPGRCVRTRRRGGRRLPAGSVGRELVRWRRVAVANTRQAGEQRAGRTCWGWAAAGLPGVHHAASATTLWGWLTVVGLLMIAAIAVAGVVAWRRWGPGRMRGMATILEAHELLGEDRLYRVRHVVRPDLYPASRKAQR